MKSGVDDRKELFGQKLWKTPEQFVEKTAQTQNNNGKEELVLDFQLYSSKTQ